MDIRTLLVMCICATAFVGVLMLLYRSRQIVYPGFGHWIAACFFLSLGFLFIVLRGAIPLAASALVGNGLFMTGASLRLDGTRRFLNRPKLPEPYYYLLLIPMAGLAWYLFARDAISIRTAIISLVFVILAFSIAWELLCHAPSESPLVYRTAAVMHLVFCVITTARSLIWLIAPNNQMLTPTFLNVLYFFLLSLFEVGYGMCFMMMNNERVEEDLRSSERNLREKNAELARAISEVKTLSGLLPICAHCKMIRNDTGYWQRIEHYIQEHSDAQFSHGICPDCMRKLYPEVADELDEEGK
ncbi:MAG: hypothetical protein AB1921_17140 [Thermodesulfobacteriota bacterium]